MIAIDANKSDVGGSDLDGSDPGEQMPERGRARAWFEALRDRLCAAVEGLEDAYRGPGHDLLDAGRFERRPWRRPGGGGGTIAILRGRVFEKIGINVSTVWGELEPDFAARLPGAEVERRFWASGISLVAHPRNPHVPPAHMNTRHVSTSRGWFGGGADLNPIVPYPEDTAAFHAALKAACDSRDRDCHARYKAWADEYFFIPHRGEARGVGGIFFDYLEDDFERDLAFTQAVGDAFADVYPRLAAARMATAWSETERQEQLRKRGRYVEFNLLYDRGTQFGLRTGGNAEAILMSLPPLVAWP